MQKKILGYTLIILVLFFANISGQFFFRNIRTASPVEVVNNSNYRFKIILMPLDSRPACTQFVEQLASIASIQIIIPPPELLDNYKTPANKKALRAWLRNACKTADAAIISIDMLTHGSLLASRLGIGTSSDSDDTINLLKAIHTENPQVKLYAFNIIPRLLLADIKENEAFQKNMLTYSVLKNEVYTFENPKDLEKLSELESQIPPDIITKYNDMYANNARTNVELTNLVEQNILAGLVIGQDDGQPFGIPNINKQLIQNYITNHSLDDKVVVTRGTDEVALTLLGSIGSSLNNYHPRVHVIYSDQDAPRITMPYMPHTVATTVHEKIKLIGGIEVSHPEDADFILFVHIGTQKNAQNLSHIAKQVKQLLDQGYHVALVDLSENFDGSQTLLPILKTANITKLIAYAGWNTTSNSIGTAVTQAALFSSSLQYSDRFDDVLSLYQVNLEFLIARFLDDWYFQKDVQPIVNNHLKLISVDPYNLAEHYEWTNSLVNNMMHNNARILFKEYIYNEPISINTNIGSKEVYITELTIQSNLPWSRTFEIWVNPSIRFAIIN